MDFHRVATFTKKGSFSYLSPGRGATGRVGAKLRIGLQANWIANRRVGDSRMEVQQSRARRRKIGFLLRFTQC